MHLGRASIDVKGVDADKAGRRKYVVALPRGLERPGMLPSEITVAADIKQLIPDQAERLTFQRQVAGLQSIAERQVTAAQIVEIINSALESLGLLTHPELREAQITRHAQKSAPLDYSETYVATKRAGARGFSVNNTYSVLVVPEGKSRTVVDLAKTLSGEFAHIIQRVSRSRSQLGAVSRLPSLGRSKVLAEAGAAKLEAMAGELFGEPPRTLNRYHYDMVMKLVQGGSFWEVYNVALGAIKERDGTAQAGVTSKEARTALKTVMRVYELGGATADPARPEGRRPTSTTLLRYVLQGVPPYDQVPYYVSGVPSHRPEVTALLPEPIVGGRMITEGTILRSVVGALHHILVELPNQ